MSSLAFFLPPTLYSLLPLFLSHLHSDQTLTYYFVTLSFLVCHNLESGEICLSVSDDINFDQLLGGAFQISPHQGTVFLLYLISNL